MPTHKTADFPKPESWEELEKICVDLIEKEWEAKDAQRYGRQGQSQEGIDILCSPYWMDEKYCAIQVKNTELNWGDIKKEIRSVEGSDFEIKEYYIFTSMDSDTHLQKKVKKENNKRKEEGEFEIKIWMWKKIKRKLADFPDLLESYYPQYFEEIREQEAEEKAEKFRSERVDKLDEDTPTEFRTPDHGKLVLQIFSLKALEEGDKSEIEDIRDIPEPLVVGSTYGHDYAYEGAVSYFTIKDNNNEEVMQSYCRVFNIGYIELVDYFRLRDQKIHPKFQWDIVKALRETVEYLSNKDFGNKFFVGISLLDVKGYEMVVRKEIIGINQNRKISQEQIKRPLFFLEKGDNFEEELKEDFDKIWRACGYKKSLSYQNGELR